MCAEGLNNKPEVTYSGFTQSCKMLSVHSRACSTLSLENLTGEGEWHASRLELNQDSH